jgi:hypothetical protein
MAQTTVDAKETSRIEIPSKSYQLYNVRSKPNNASSILSTNESEASILMSIFSKKSAGNVSSARMNDTGTPFTIEDRWAQPLTHKKLNRDISDVRSLTLPDYSASKVSTLNQSRDNDHRVAVQEPMRAFSTPPMRTGRSRGFGGGIFDFTKWSRIYLFGTEYGNGVPRI